MKRRLSVTNASTECSSCHQGESDGRMEMLGTGKLRGDPTATQENRLSHKLKGLEKNGEITNGLYNRLRPMETNPLGFMACPKSRSLMYHSDPLFCA